MSKSIIDRSELPPIGGENEPFKVGSRHVKTFMIDLGITVNWTKQATDTLLIWHELRQDQVQATLRQQVKECLSMSGRIVTN